MKELAARCLWCFEPVRGADGYLCLCAACQREYEEAAAGMPREADVPEEPRVPEGLCRSGCGRRIAVGRRRHCGECGIRIDRARRAGAEARRRAGA